MLERFALRTRVQPARWNFPENGALIEGRNSDSRWPCVLPGLTLILLAASLFAQNYTVQESNTNENLRGLSVPSPEIIWASGTHGTYLRSTDGGDSWQIGHVAGAEALDFRDVVAFGAELAYLLSAGPGDQSRIYKTTDGGRNWTLQFTNSDAKGFFDCFAFWDPQHGIVLGDPVSERGKQPRFQLITTEDGGQTWKRIPAAALPPAINGEGAFAASGSCIAVEGKANVWFASGGRAARVFRSTDAGQTWTVASTKIVHGADSSGIFSIAFRDSKHGVIAGGDYQQPAQGGPDLAFTDDGGLSWQLAVVEPQSYFSSVVWVGNPVASSPAILVGGSVQAAYTDRIENRDWNRAWYLNLNTVGYCAPGKAIAVGPKGLIVRLVIPQ